MKKIYKKPVICCQNLGTGEIITNSHEFAENCREKITNNPQLQQEIQKLLREEKQQIQ